ncbi:hypothetical protein B0H13DRAFT_1859658 [Mycena leptocephala]|nr:hypothetical protein B0H13DRAFT_1859658 [Mycena leptocephala]
MASGTSLERTVRWRAAAPGRHGAGPQADLPAGNSTNAAVTAKALAKKASSLPVRSIKCLLDATKRKEVFTASRVPNLGEVIGARVSPLRPLHIGNYGVILTAHGLMVGHVFRMNAKGGGKYEKHEPLFEKLHGSQFRAIPTATAVLHTKQLGHIPPINFICLLTTAPKPLPTGLELTTEDSERFKTLAQGLGQLNEAMTSFRKRRKRGVAAGGDSGDDLDEDLQ